MGSRPRPRSCCAPCCSLSRKGPSCPSAPPLSPRGLGDVSACYHSSFSGLVASLLLRPQAPKGHLPRLRLLGVLHSWLFGCRLGHEWGRRFSHPSPPWLIRLFLPELTGPSPALARDPPAVFQLTSSSSCLHPHADSEKPEAGVTPRPDPP